MTYRGTVRARIAISVIIATIGGAATVPLHSQRPQCGNSPNIPLTDLTRAYRGLDFGLYPGKRTTLPDAHLAIGIERARTRIQPRDVNGHPSGSGKIILLSVGMSNTRREFTYFMTDAQKNPALNRRLVIVNGSLGGADATMWTDPKSLPWQMAMSQITRGGNSANQVQVIWIKQAHLQTSPFQSEVELLRTHLDSIVRIAKSVFPNLQIVYVSSRTRAGAESFRGPGEPQAYETAFAVRRLVQAQIEGTGALGVDVAWLSWGPYLWSNGTARSDGFVWDCNDLVRDMIHPSESGNQKVADQLTAFFMTAETAIPWFLEPSGLGRGPEIMALTPSTREGAAPLTVDFIAKVSGTTRYFWSFGDGTFSSASNPRKTFFLEGVYKVHLTATDAAGKWANSSVEIRVGRRVGSKSE